MNFLLLLALVLVAGIATLQFTHAIDQRSFSQLFFAIGFVFIGLGLFAQLVLNFALDEAASKLFFWSRSALTLAWFGQGMLILLLPYHPITRRMRYGILSASLAIFALVFLSQVTEAQDWYSTNQPIYSQIGDLLATNRPTRWGALALNVFGFMLLSGSVFAAMRKATPRSRHSWFIVALIIVGAMGLIIPIYLPPLEKDLIFYLVELLSPVALFIGLRSLSSSVWPSNRNLA